MGPRLLILFALLCGCSGQSSSSTSPGEAAPGAAPTTPFEELLVRGGVFSMGSEDGERDERPVHQVQVESFYIDKHEVTNALYRAFLEGTRREGHGRCPSDEPPDKDHVPAMVERSETTHGFPTDYFTNPGYDSYPIIGVDWHDARAFAAWHGRRLLSELEWEYAARSAESRRFPWGANRPLDKAPRANFYTPRRGDRRGWQRIEKFGATKLAHADGFSFTAPVGSFPLGAARCEALDLAGNVWEWTSSRYSPYGDAARRRGSSEPLQVVRGGAWDSPSSFLLRAANRVRCKATVRRSSIGFRTARNLTIAERAAQ